MLNAQMRCLRFGHHGSKQKVLGMILQQGIVKKKYISQILHEKEMMF